MKKRPCIGFCMTDASEAYRHMDTETVEDYGDICDKNQLHTWDEGGRRLLRCKKCGGFILFQLSERHGIEEDDYYADYFPVSGPEEARRLNVTYDGYSIERDFPGRWLICDPCRVPRWSDHVRSECR